MSSEYDRLMREYNVPPGVLNEDELQLLRQGGYKLDDSDEEADYDLRGANRHARPKLPSYNINTTMEVESLKQIYEDKLSMKEKQLNFLQQELNNRDQLMEA